MRPKTLLNLAGDRLYTLPLIVLYITDGCNSRCVTCDIWKNPRRNMSMSLVEDLAETFRELQVRHVLLSGGEAMQHPHWADIARRFKAEGARVMLLTNGLYVQKQAQDIIEHVDDLIISLDGGTPETYREIRGVDGFDLVLAGIRAARAGGVPVTTRTTTQRQNFREIPKIIEVAQDADVNSISFLAVDINNPFAFGQRFKGDAAIPLIANMGDGAPAEHGPAATALTPDDVRELRQLLDEIEVRFADAFARGQIAESPAKLRRILLGYFDALYNPDADYAPPPCNAPHFSTVIEVDGKLRPCYFLPDYGRLKRNGVRLPEMINVDAAQALRKAYRTGQRPECARCVCPLYKNPGALLRM